MSLNAVFIFSTYLVIFSTPLVNAFNRNSGRTIVRDSIQQAFQEARQKFTSFNNVISQRQGEICARALIPDRTNRAHASVLWASPQILRNAELARISERATQLFAARTSASRQDIQDFPNTISVRQTRLNLECPSDVKPESVRCDPAAERSIDGRCNNLANPLWGSTNTAQARLLPPVYENGINSPRMLSIRGSALPSGREISTCLSPSMRVNHTSLTLAGVFFGQFVDHDLVLTPAARIDDLAGQPVPPTCCYVPASCLNEECFPIAIPPNDPFYSIFNQTCMDMVRSVPALRESCKLGTREQANQVTAFIDLSQVYGSTSKRERELRAYRKGLLRINLSVPARRKQLELLPPSLKPNSSDFECMSPDLQTTCFAAGDERVNEQPVLTAFHTVFMREHNRIARALADIFRRNQRVATDEEIFQAARKINIAQYQHIVYNELVPLILGNTIVGDPKNELDLCNFPGQSDLKTYCSQGYYSGYSAQIPPLILNEFSTAAYRWGHTAIAEMLVETDINAGSERAEPLSNKFFQPFSLYERGGVEGAIYGSMTNSAEDVDTVFAPSIHNRLFREDKPFGKDLNAVNIQRGRDHGIPSYNFYRSLCGLRRARTFDDLFDTMDRSAISRLRCTYADVDDIDLFAGGVAERPVNNGDGVVGTVFSCIIAQQFHQLKKGDRFWYENKGRFTRGQLLQIKRATSARIMCDNTEITRSQPFLFLQQTPRLNSETFCRNLPRLNLDAFANMQF